MSKEFLGRTLEADVSEPNGVTTAGLAYLAVLHFASSEYQQAIRLCFAVLTDQTSQKEKEILNAGYLLFNDDVARIVGLCVLCKVITGINLPCTGRHLHLDLRFSPEVFAHYLTVFSYKRRSTRLEFGRNLPDSSFFMDNNLKALIRPNCFATVKSGTQRNESRQIVFRRIDSLTETQKQRLQPRILR